MDDKTRQMHLDIGQYYGQEHTCGAKVDYKSEVKADEVAAKLSIKFEKEMEGYPCYFCNGWHIGRKLTELEKRYLG